MTAASPLLGARLSAQHLAGGKASSPSEAVTQLLAVQAQDYAAALWAIGLRTEGATADNVEQAIAQRRIVRTWPMRGTLHFVAAGDVRWLQHLLAARVLARESARQERGRGLDATTLKACRKAIERILRDGEPMARPDVYAALERHGIATGAGRGLYILLRLAHEGLICQGPRIGRQPAFVWMDAWVAPAPPLPRDEALARLGERYVAGHGPATAHDLAWWSGLTLKDAKSALELAADRVVAEDIDGVRHWRHHAAPAPGMARGVLLLPAFDEYLLGYKDRTPVLDAAHHRKVFTVNGIIQPCVVTRGRVVGTWPRAGAGFEPKPFRPLSETQARDMQAAAKRHARFWSR